MPHRAAKTLVAIVMGSPKLAAHRTQVKTELDEVSRIKGLLPAERRRLLQLIHAMRAFDTTLGHLEK